MVYSIKILYRFFLWFISSSFSTSLKNCLESFPDSDFLFVSLTKFLYKSLLILPLKLFYPHTSILWNQSTLVLLKMIYLLTSSPIILYHSFCCQSILTYASSLYLTYLISSCHLENKFKKFTFLEYGSLHNQLPICFPIFLFLHFPMLLHVTYDICELVGQYLML